MGRPLARLAIAASFALMVGCTPAATDPVPTPTPTPTVQREFTIGTTERITATDPVAVTDSMSTSAVLAAFQRLMTVDPGTANVRPDAAKECQFTSPTVYECSLREGLEFANFAPLTSSDVMFSINRARRLGVPGSSASQLGALDHIETPDARTVRFVLKWPDGQFGFALATPAASIVDEKEYDPDAIRPITEPVLGSGAMQLFRNEDAGYTLRRNQAFQGTNYASLPVIVVRYYPDSGALEDAMKNRAVDVVWRGLSAAALKRYDDQITANATKRTDAGFTRVTLTGRQIHLLAWSPTSAFRLDATLRTAVAAVLREDRTLDSLIPVGVPGHTAAFPMGGVVTSVRPLPGELVRLTLSYASTIVGEKEKARDIRDQIESRMGVAVQLVPDRPDADLALLNYRAWTSTAAAWLQPYRESPLPGSAAKVAELEERARSSVDAANRDTALAEIQKQAQADAIVLPVSQADDDMFLGPDVKLLDPKFGPGWQLSFTTLGK